LIGFENALACLEQERILGQTPAHFVQQWNFSQSSPAAGGVVGAGRDTPASWHGIKQFCIFGGFLWLRFLPERHLRPGMAFNNFCIFGGFLWLSFLPERHLLVSHSGG